MDNTNYQELAFWCLATQALRNRILRHRGLGNLRVLKVLDDAINVEFLNRSDADKTIQISSEFFLDEFENLLSKNDINELTQLWLEAERRAEIEAAERAEREQQRAAQLREQELRVLEIARQRLLPIKDFIDLNLCALAVPMPIEIPSPVPTSEDLNLIECWKHAEHATRESEERRLLSARLAERAVASFFKGQGFEVEDVSVTQLHQNPNPDWPDFDIRIKGKPLDVKNARRSRQNPDRYVSYCVPRFKETRNREDVAIAGTLSHWLPVTEMKHGGKSVLFLGISRLSDQERLRGDFGGGALSINFREGGRGFRSFLPPWMFEYPQRMYHSRDKALAGLKNLATPDWSLCAEGKLNPLPAHLAAGLKYDGHPNPPLIKFQSEFIARFMSRTSEGNLSLGVIFLSILEHFLEVLSNGPAEEYSPTSYIPLLFPTEDRSRPLFVYDPLRTINALLNCLSVLWQERSDRLKDFSLFRLQDFNILQGKRHATDLQWTTLLAYCGGWVEEPTLRPCGRTPLVLGQCKTCACGKLICPDCGFCSEGCTLRKNPSDH